MDDDRQELDMSREMWVRFEIYHDVVYAPEASLVAKELGCRGGWMGYFGTRSAPLGAASPEVVTAAFFNFHPQMVAKAVPQVWSVASPERFLQARLEIVDAALRRMLGADVAGLEEMVTLAASAAAGVPPGGRVLGAANQALPPPPEPHLALWQSCSTLRESRGDGHVAALVAAGLAPCEALVLFTADKGLDPAYMRRMRGWSEQEWQEAEAALVGRRLLTGGGLTVAGRELRAEIERWTDIAAAAPWQALGAGPTARLRDLMTPVVQRLSELNESMKPNPMALDPAEIVA
ncbi:hypothetical protein HCB17_25405 [Salinispora arenicola]|nr:hypothetical protein [Salinispora arenicola]